MNNEFFEALTQLEKEKGIEGGYLLEKIKNAIVIAVKKDFGGNENVFVEIDPDKGQFKVFLGKEVVEEVFDSDLEMSMEEAVKHSKKAVIGDIVRIELETKQFGRIAAQTAKHVIRQGIREAERNLILEEFQSKEHEIVSGTVTRIDNKKGIISVEIGRSETILPKSEQIAGEVIREGDRIRVYVVEVLATERGPKIMISRTHPGLVKRMFEMEVPEIFDGTVEIASISREAGSRTKMAVRSTNPDVDPVGACIGNRGTRIVKIVDELGGEKIDVVKFSEDPKEYVAAALSPANVIEVEIINEETRECKATVPDDQISLAIGNKGQNARLAAKLTGYKIDIKPQSGFFGE